MVNAEREFLRVRHQQGTLRSFIVDDDDDGRFLGLFDSRTSNATAATQNATAKFYYAHPARASARTTNI